MRFTPARIGEVIAIAIATTATLSAATPASVVTLRGSWAPFNRCPVNEPALRNAPASLYGNGCAASSSSRGSFRINNAVVTTESTELQFGLAGTTASGLGQIVPAANDETLVAEPEAVPGGLLGLMCPSNVLLVSELCSLATKNGLNDLTAQVELAGAPTEFSQLAGLVPGSPLLNLPVKLHLENPLLGASCYLGSNAEPIVLRPETIATGPMRVRSEKYQGHEVVFETIGPETIGPDTLGDSSFAVPGASGCGGLLAALVDEAIDLKHGLPSPPGKNDLVLESAISHLADMSKASGQVLAEAWNAAIEA